mgnify:CR=1 FL=1
MTVMPERFENVTELEDFMTRPVPGLAEDLAKAPGAITILGIGGKMGPSLARMAKRVDPDRKIIGVARFSDETVRQNLEDAGVETVACDLLDEAAVRQLEVTENVIFMAGMKFGASGNEPLTWAMNSCLRLSVRGYSPSGCDRGCLADAAGRVCKLLRRTGADLPVFFGKT